MFIGRTDAKAETPIFGHLMQRTDSLEKTLMLGKIEGRRENLGPISELLILEVCNIVQEAVTKTIPEKKKCKNAK